MTRTLRTTRIQALALAVATAIGMSSIAYAHGDPDTGLVVYADRAVPANRRARRDA